MTVEFDRSFLKSLSNIKDKSILKRIKNIIIKLENSDNLKAVISNWQVMATAMKK